MKKSLSERKLIILLVYMLTKQKFMRKVDVVIELDYMSLKYINKWAERYHHCNPRNFENVSNLYTDEELKEIDRVGAKNQMIQEWDGEAKNKAPSAPYHLSHFI